MWANNKGAPRQSESYHVGPRGYVVGHIWQGDEKRFVKQHRIIMERHLGRALRPDEVVHHKDGNKANNAIENLEVMTHGEHSALHNRERAFIKGESA